MTDVLTASLPLLLLAATAGSVALLVTRALRDDAVVDAVRIEVRRIGETHRAVCESRSIQGSRTADSGASQRRRG